MNFTTFLQCAILAVGLLLIFEKYKNTSDMKNIIKYSKVLFLLSLVLLISDCKKDKFLNVNTNPNYPGSVPVNLLLPTCEANIGYMVGNTLGIYGGLWSQYWTQDPTYGSQYGNFDSYLNVPSDNDNVWQALYTTAANLNFIIANSDTGHQNYAAIAYFMKAYDFQLICDGWGDVPCSTALKGSANLSPSFDPGQQVYDSIESWVYSGLKILNLNYPSPTEDLIYPGSSDTYLGPNSADVSMIQWQKFANTLLMKVYLRERAKNTSRANNGFTKLNTTMTTETTANTAAGFAPASFLSAAPTTPGSDIGGDDATLHYQAVTFQQYPLYATQVYLQVQNICASATVINYMNSLNDPRIADFFTINPADSVYVGELQGDYKALSGQPNVFAGLGSEILSPTTTQRLMTASESDFLQAEALVDGYTLYGVAGNAGTLYANGISASFASWTNSSAVGATAYLANTSVAWTSAVGSNGQLNFIWTQKWLSMCGNQNFEAWCEWRRSKPHTPTFFTVSAATQAAPGKFPLRLVYPSAEFNDNANFPGEQSITTPVWWDTN
jgi:hypothetical protein